MNSNHQQSIRTSVHGERAGFTILEVMIACSLFFIVAFAVLGMVSQGIVGARALQRKEPDAGLVAAALTLTNQFKEGIESGDFEDMYPGVYPGYTWTTETTEVYSNGLYQINIAIQGAKKGGDNISSVYMWCPTCPPGSATKGGLR